MKTNLNLYSIFRALSIAFAFSALLTGCSKDSVGPEVNPPEQVNNYDNGFFLLNEGWFGNGTGSISFFDYTSGMLSDSVYQKENPDKDLMPTTATLQYGTIFNGKLFLVSKAGGAVVIADASTLKEEGRIPAAKGNDWRAFAGMDENTGLLSSSDGIYILNLKDLSTNLKLSGANGQIGDLFVSEDYIFALSQRDGALVYRKSDLSLVKKIEGVSLGFAQTPNKKIWYTAGEYLVNMDPSSLKADSIPLPFTPESTWFAWYSSPIIASSKQDAIYLMKAAAFGGGKELYKYVDGQTAAITKPFLSTPENQSFYKNNLGYDSKLDQIITTTVQDGWGENYTVNMLYFYDAKNGDLKKIIPFNKIRDAQGKDVSYFFPVMPIFHNN